MIFDFKCDTCDTYKEAWVPSQTRYIRCNTCGEDMVRVITGVTSILDPISGDFPGATLKWAKHHEQAAKRSSD